MKQILGSVILAVGLLAAPQSDTRKAQSLMQAAQSKETIDGDLKAAIDLYRQAVRSAGKDRALAAKALLRVAACQEKQGAAEAKKTYQEILRNYSDQAEAVSIARLKLGVSAGDGPAQVTTRQLWNSIDMGNVGSVSPDGRCITFTNWESGDIRIIDLTTGDTRTLFSRGGGEKSGYEFGMNSLFSPDGKQIVFSWFRGQGASLKVTTPVGGGVRTVGGEGEYGLVTGWLPDGRRVVTVGDVNRAQSDRRILIVDLADGSKKEIARVPAAVSAQLNALASPDGNYILFDRRKSAAAAMDRDIYIVPVAGGEARPLISDLSNENLVSWTPDGSRLVFSSSRGTGPGLYMVAFRDGKLEGEPTLLKEGLRGFPMGFDRKGNYYYNGGGGGAMILRVAAFDPAAGKATGPAKIVPMRRGMGTSNFPIWTPDGRMLAFQRRPWSNEDTGTEFVISDPDTGAEAKVIQTSLDVRQGLRFRPDGSAVAKEVGPGQLLSAMNVNWEKGVLEPFQLVESSDKGNVCAGPSVRVHNPGEGILIADYASNKLWRLTDRRFSNGGVIGGAVSPDCKFIAYIANSPRSIRLLDVATGSERELVSMEEPFSVGYWPIFTPDGKRLLFIRTKSEREAAELWSVPVSGGTPAPTGIAIHNLRNPVLSPDGRRLAFTGGQNNYEAYVVEGLLPASLRGQR